MGGCGNKGVWWCVGVSPGNQTGREMVQGRDTVKAPTRLKKKKKGGVRQNVVHTFCGLVCLGRVVWGGVQMGGVLGDKTLQRREGETLDLEGLRSSGNSQNMSRR